MLEILRGLVKPYLANVKLELIQLLGDPDIVSNVRLGRLRWIGHINRMSNNRKVKQIFKSQPQGTRLKGGPKKRWWDCVRQDLEKCKIKIGNSIRWTGMFGGGSLRR